MQAGCTNPVQCPECEFNVLNHVWRKLDLLPAADLATDELKAGYAVVLQALEARRSGPGGV